MKSFKFQKGFVALMTVIIITAVLTATAFSLSYQSYFSRANSLYAEYKAKSAALAQGCLENAKLSLAQNPSFNPSSLELALSADPTDRCTIIGLSSDSPSVGQTKIITSASFQKATTNYQAIIDSTNFSVLSQAELPSL